MSKVSCLYHIVISTYARKMTIPEESKNDLYRYINGMVERYNSRLIRINGIGNHVHILLDLHPTVALAALIQSIKMGSNKYMSGNPKFPFFDHWGKEYFAFSVSSTSCEKVKNYIINQEEHHHRLSFEEEMRGILERAGVEWNEHILG